MELDKDLIQRMLLRTITDLRKPDITPFERGQIVKAYLEQTGISIRQLAKEIGLPKSTVQDWAVFGKVDEAKYKEFKDAGYTDKDIYKSLRNQKGSEMTDATIGNQIKLFLLMTEKSLIKYIGKKRFFDKIQANKKKEIKEQISTVKQKLEELEKCI